MDREDHFMVLRDKVPLPFLHAKAHIQTSLLYESKLRLHSPTELRNSTEQHEESLGQGIHPTGMTSSLQWRSSISLGDPEKPTHSCPAM